MRILVDLELLRCDKVPESGLVSRRSDVRRVILYSLAALFILAHCRSLDFALRLLKLRSMLVLV